MKEIQDDTDYLRNVTDYKSPFSWEKYLVELFRDIGHPNLDQQLLVPRAEYIKDIYVLLTETAPEDLGEFLTFLIVIR